MDIADLPAVNATLNATSAVLLVAGYSAIRRKRVAVHRGLMVAAFACSTAFLTCYLVYHAYAGSKPFPGLGWTRPAYYAMLISHVVLAAALMPLVLMTLWRAVRGRFDRHRRLARWTLPIWMYVSVTGVVIYVVLYQIYSPN